MADPVSYPSYVSLAASGQLAGRIETAYKRLASCDLCPRRCGVDRARGRLGFCKGGLLPQVSSSGPHFGEEDVLVGRNGSGTIFFTGCNLRCSFCQNYEISHYMAGGETGTEDLAALMLRLERLGCHNINLVTPTHFLPQIVAALSSAAEAGLRLPVVYNCGGYEDLDALRLLEGIVDIYMPDFKFWSPAASARYLEAPNYPEIARAALREMHRQVGDLVVREGLAVRGLLVRHLVMPGGVADASSVFDFLSREISRETFVNVMDQYRPCYRAGRFPEIARKLKPDEFEAALAAARRAGLERICS
jgi:putative pyruvate formate lyase activating enzyme